MVKGKLKKKNPGQNEGETVDGEKNVTSPQEVAGDAQPTKNEQSEKADELADAATGSEAAATGGKTENEKSNEKQGLKRKRIKNKNKKKKQGQNGNDSKKPQASGGGKEEELAGLIFMCNSATKQDCFRYHVFGLPEGKRALVEKVTKGMRLFLYDFDQRLLYGIFKAIGRGGSELEPNAFRSSERKFPAQVRFRIQKECLPLPEEKFKAAIKDNYFGKKRFKFELNVQQVKNLSQLFRSAPLGSRGTREGNLGRPAPPREYAGDIPQREGRLKRPYREDSRRIPRGDYIPQVPLYGPDVGIPEREVLRHAPVGDPYASAHGPDPYAPLYQRPQLPPVDPLPGREGLIPDLDYHGRDPQLDLLYQQRLELDMRKRRLEEAAYLDEIKKSYAPLGSEYGDPYLYRDPLRRADLLSSVPAGPAIPHPSVIGPSPGYRY